MELSEIWIAYCEERFPQGAAFPQPEPVSPTMAAELFFDLHPLFRARMDGFTNVPYNTAFDDEADGALAHMARFDTFERWGELSAGAWRVLYERFVYAQAVVLANEAAKEPVIGHLPVGLDRDAQSKALLLKFLLGGARTIDRELLPPTADGSLPTLPAGTPLRKH